MARIILCLWTLLLMRIILLFSSTEACGGKTNVVPYLVGHDYGRNYITDIKRPWLEEDSSQIGYVSPRSGHYRGCFKNDSRPVIPALSSAVLEKNTPQLCIHFCAGFKYAGLEKETRCFCSNVEPTRAVNQNNCNKPCPGDETETCGGDSTSDVFDVPPFHRPYIQYKGCFYDSSGTVLPDEHGAIPYTLTPYQCANMCYGYKFAGVRRGTECHCGNTITPSPEAGTYCDATCSGDVNRRCGGWKYIAVYGIAQSSVTTHPPPDYYGRSHGQVYMGMSQQDGGLLSRVGKRQEEGRHIGCFQDERNPRALPLSTVVLAANTPELCIRFCAGFKYAGVESTDQCYCGDEQPTNQVVKSYCNYPCPGDGSETCGGSWKMNVYTVPYIPWPDLHYKGCIKANLLTGPHYTLEKTLTPHQCINMCHRYKYAGVQKGNECYCGNFVPVMERARYSDDDIDYEDDDDDDDLSVDILAESEMMCGKNCSGDPSRTCGGQYSMALYQREQEPGGSAPVLSKGYSYFADVETLVQINDAGKRVIVNKHDCTFNVKDELIVPDPLPLILHTDRNTIRYPDKEGWISVSQGGSLRLRCPGRANYVSAFGLAATDVTVECWGGIFFTYNFMPYSITRLGCETHPVHTLTEMSRTSYWRVIFGSSVQIMVDVHFVAPAPISMYQVFFDMSTLNTLWSRQTIETTISGGQATKRVTNYFAKVPHFAGIDMNEVYGKNGQVRRLTTLLGSEEQAKRYVKTDPSSQFYLAQGHLTANADFIYRSEMRTTFYLLNAAPQWQIVNNGNWKKLETSVRDYASKNYRNFVVFTGTHGVTSLPDVNYNPVKLYLYAGNKIPVPAVYWKVVIGDDAKLKGKTQRFQIRSEGIAFVVVNNPYIEEHDLKDADIPCKRAVSVCNQVSSWVSWNDRNKENGLYYCCRVEDLWADGVAMPDDEYDLNIHDVLA